MWMVRCDWIWCSHCLWAILAISVYLAIDQIVYGTMFRVLWAIALAWVIFACHNGWGGKRQVNKATFKESFLV